MSDKNLELNLGIVTTGLDKGLNSALSALKGFTLNVGGLISVGAVLKTVIKEAISSEKSFTLLKQSMGSARDGSIAMAKTLDNLIVSTAKMSGFASEELSTAMRKVTIATGSASVAMDSMQVIMDMAIAKNMSLEAAATLVSRAYTKGTDNLRKYNINIKENVKGQEALTQIGKLFAGTTDAYLETTEGKYKAMMSTLNELARSIGAIAIPIIKDMIDNVKFAADWWQNLTNKVNDNSKATSKAAKNIEAEMNTYSGIYSKLMLQTDEHNANVLLFKANNPEKFKAMVKQREDALMTYNKLKNKLQNQNAADANKKEKDIAGTGGEDTGIVSLKRAELLTTAELETQYYNDSIAEKNKYNATMLSLTRQYGETYAKLQMALQSKELQGVQQGLSVLASQYTSLQQMQLDNNFNRQKKALEQNAEAQIKAGGDEVKIKEKLAQDLVNIQNERDKALFETNKAMAMATIPMETAKAAMDIYAGFSQIPVVGQALGLAAAIAAIGFGAARLAEVSASQFNPAGAKDGIFDFRAPGNNEKLITTLDKGESIIPKSMTDAIKTGEASLGGGLTVIVQGPIYGVDSKDITNKITQNIKSGIQSGTIKVGRLSGATS